MRNHPPKPPHLAEKVLEWYCDDPLVEEIAGDLEERFLDHVETYGKRKARIKYCLNVVKFFRGHTLKRRKSNRYTQNNIAMFKNYFKIAFRNAIKQKAYTFINLSGLAIGLTSFILIMLYVQHQMSYDQFHDNKNQIYRITDGVDAITPNIVGPLVKRSFEDEVAGYVRVGEMEDQLFTVGQEIFRANVFYADSTFFQVFTFPLVQGDKATVLDQPNGMVISERMALQRFGKLDVMNESFKMGRQDFKITGIMKNVPSNSMMQFDYIMPFNALSWTSRETWSNSNYWTFFELNDGVKSNFLAEKITGKLYGGEDVYLLNDGAESFYLQPLTEIYLQADMKLDYDFAQLGDVQYVYIFLAVAVLILLIACINYVNLATSRSLERAKEVGVRKVVGAQRGQLIYQFLSESFLFVFGALVISIVLVWSLVPSFNELAGVQLNPESLLNTEFIITLVGLGVVIALLSGCYPALMLSGFRPVAVLKGNFRNSETGSRLRKGLVIFQFAISAFLLVATLVVNKQLNFIQDKNLGYDREQVVAFRLNGDFWRGYQTVKNELLSNPNIEGVTMASNTPIDVGSAHGIQTGPTEDDEALIYFLHVDQDFTDLMGMNLLAGQNLHERAVTFAQSDTATQAPSYIINETTADLFNWSAEEAIGKTINISGTEAPVQAVVEDFHFRSLHQEIEPFIMLYDRRRFRYAMIKLKGENMGETLDFIEKKVSEVAPTLPFDYHFLDDRFNSLYRFESRLSDVFITFASIAIIIASMGMFGLISFMALNRAKEMGIRKVLGASVSHIVILLSKDFLKLVVIAMLLAMPLAYYFMGGWLQDYQYHISLGADTGIIAILSALFITTLTIGYQALKTGLVSPSKVLRNE